MIADGRPCAVSRHDRSARRWHRPGAALARRRNTGSAATCSAATCDSRVVFGARVSLIVGFAWRWRVAGIWARSSAWCRLQPMVDSVVMRVMDGLMSIPSDPAGDRADGADPASLGAERDLRHHVGEIAARLPAGAQRRARPARAAVCGGGDRRPAPGMPMIIIAHPAEHAGAADGERDLHPRVGDDHRGDAVVHRRRHAARSFRAGATSWPRGRSALAGEAITSCVFPAIFLRVTVLAVNLLGDGLRDALDPRLARRMSDG